MTSITDGKQHEERIRRDIGDARYDEYVKQGDHSAFCAHCDEVAIWMHDFTILERSIRRAFQAELSTRRDGTPIPAWLARLASYAREQTREAVASSIDSAMVRARVKLKLWDAPDGEIEHDVLVDFTDFSIWCNTFNVRHAKAIEKVVVQKIDVEPAKRRASELKGKHQDAAWVIGADLEAVRRARNDLFHSKGQTEDEFKGDKARLDRLLRVFAPGFHQAAIWR